MVHEEQRVVRGPFRSREAVWGSSAVGTEAGHVATKVCQSRTLAGQRSRTTAYPPGKDEMGTNMCSLYGRVRKGEKE